MKSDSNRTRDELDRDFRDTLIHEICSREVGISHANLDQRETVRYPACDELVNFAVRQICERAKEAGASDECIEVNMEIDHRGQKACCYATTMGRLLVHLPDGRYIGSVEFAGTRALLSVSLG